MPRPPPPFPTPFQIVVLIMVTLRYLGRDDKFAGRIPHSLKVQQVLCVWGLQV